MNIYMQIYEVIAKWLISISSPIGRLTYVYMIYYYEKVASDKKQSFASCSL